MTHETAQQRRRRHKADPYRAQILAPKAEMKPVVCSDCGCPRLKHALNRPGECAGCGECTEYVEAS